MTTETQQPSSLAHFLFLHFIPLMVVGWLGLSVMWWPLLYLVARHQLTPPAADGAAYRDGAYAACVTFGVGAGAPRSDYEPFCEDMADELAAARP